MNPETPQFRAHCERLIGQLPGLADEVVSRTLESLRSPKGDLAVAPDRKSMFSLASQIQLHQWRLKEALTHRFQVECTSVHPSSHEGKLAKTPISLNELSLVDESTAETTIEVARTVQLINMETEWSLREFQSYTSALCGLTDIRPDLNPFSPAAFARALSDGFTALALPEAERKLALRVAGQELAQLLNEFYTATNLHLKQEGHSPLDFRTIVNLNAPSGSVLDMTRPGALDAFLHHLPGASVMNASMVSMAIDRALQQLHTHQGVAQVNDARAVLGLSQLLERMVRESGATPLLQPLVRSLQTCMLRLSLNEPEMAEDLQHPSWLLMNDVVTHVSGFRPEESSDKRQFIDQIQPIIDGLLAIPDPQSSHFVSARQRIQRVIDAQSATLLAARAATLKALEEADHAEMLKGLLRQQVEQHVAGHTLPIIVNDFLHGPWVDVMFHVMTQADMDEEEGLSLINVVEDLVVSLQRPSTLQERDRLRTMLPHLTERLRKGMALINLSPKQRGDLMEQLMVVHGRYLRSTPAPSATADSAHGASHEDVVARIRSEHIDSVWARLNPEPDPRLHVDALPTIPMGLDVENAAEGKSGQTADEWVETLQPGTWFKLSLHGEWIDSRLIWVSRNHRFFIFTGKQRDDILTWPRQSLAKLRREGFASEMTQHALVQRAVNSLMGDLDG